MEYEQLQNFSFLDYLNNNKYFAGIAMILLNVGSKHISTELSQIHESFLGSTIIRRLIIFTVVFTATRDIWISLIVTAIFIILVTGLFNDKSSFCMLPKTMLSQNITDRPVSKEELKYAQNIIKLANDQKNKTNHNYTHELNKKKSRINRYKNNINSIILYDDHINKQWNNQKMYNREKFRNRINILRNN